VAQEAQQRAEDSRPAIEAALGRGGPSAWDDAARIALSLGLASEVEVLDAQGDSLFSRPTVPPVVHRPGAAERRSLAGRRAASVVVQQGEAVRALVYLPLPGRADGASLRLASAAPDLQDELRERQQVFLGHLASLAALTLAVALVLLPRENDSTTAPPGALDAYEEAMERLRDRGEEMTARHEAERRRMEEAILEKDALARAGELTAGIVHEVRNGLGTIVGYARMLERAGLAEDPAAAAAAIRAECETLETVVRRFSDFVKLERMQPAPTDLARLIGRVVAREQRAHEDVRTRLFGLDAPLFLRADEELLERAFENVVRNALEAAASGGRTVEVTAVAEEGQVEVRIEDDGPGLPPGHSGEIRPFYSTRPGGLGLGLPLARKIVLLHGGTLALEGRAPQGVRAVIALPADGPDA